MKARRSYLWDGLLLLSLCLVFFWRDLTPVVTDRRTFQPGDFLQQFYAFARYEATRWYSGQIPLWNPHNLSGHPFLADIQAGVFYPLSLLTMLLTGARDFSYQALELEALAHYPLVAFFTYLLARRLTGSRVGGLVAAITFTFSAYLTSYPPLQLAILETQTWLPLILLWLDVAAERLGQGNVWAARRWTAASGLILAVALLAGHPQAALLVGYAGVAYALFRFWPSGVSPIGRAGLHRLGLVAIWGAIGVGVAAVQFVPSLEYMRLSVRSNIGFDAASSGFQPYELFQTIFPIIGGQVPALYVGLLPLGLAALAFFALRRDAQRSPSSRSLLTFLGWVVLASLLLSFGRSFGLYQLVYLFVPGWSLFRGQERIIVWGVLAVALLAGFGAAWLNNQWAAGGAEMPVGGRRVSVSERWLIRGYGLGAVAALLLALVFFVMFQSGSKPAWGFTSVSMLLAVLLLLAMLALRRRHPVFLLTFIFLELLTFNTGYHVAPSASVDLAPYHSLLTLPLADPDIFRVQNDESLPPGFALLHGLEEVGSPSPLRLRRYEEWLTRLPPERAWPLLNVKYVASWQQFLDLPAERVAEEPGPEPDKKPIYLYRVLDPMPRAWLTGRAIVQPDFAQTLQLLAAPEFDFAHQVVLAAVPASFAAAGGCSGTIEWRQRAPEHLALSVVTDAPCFLVLSEVDYPGWWAHVDGAPAPILLADGILRAVPLPAGAHEVAMDFRPTSVFVGAAISVLALALTVILLLLRRKAGQV